MIAKNSYFLVIIYFIINQNLNILISLYYNSATQPQKTVFLFATSSKINDTFFTNVFLTNHYIFYLKKKLLKKKV
ncbi:hypothetical protein SAMN05444372_106128 [Flavobacterium micromati]|uniref:Uncharacterized protein n=1 Tax=Flavobacterium micromati TaxID=229205 RepID=A0A1M5K620_9FLAO|nr:hypothetical protein SAMN05444372_106128 [Flavobacterium micromati]